MPTLPAIGSRVRLQNEPGEFVVINFWGPVGDEGMAVVDLLGRVHIRQVAKIALGDVQRAEGRLHREGQELPRDQVTVFYDDDAITAVSGGQVLVDDQNTDSARATYGGSFGGPEHTMPDAPIVPPPGAYVEAFSDQRLQEQADASKARGEDQGTFIEKSPGVVFTPPPAPQYEPALTSPRLGVHEKLQSFIQKAMGADEQTLIKWNQITGTVSPDANPDFFNIQVNILDLMEISGSGFEWLPLYLQSKWGKFLREGRKRIVTCVDALSDLAKAEAQAHDDCTKAVITHDDLRSKLADWAVERQKLNDTIKRVNTRMNEVMALMVPYNPNTVPTAALVQHLEQG